MFCDSTATTDAFHRYSCDARRIVFGVSRKVARYVFQDAFKRTLTFNTYETFDIQLTEKKLIDSHSR